MKITAQSGLQRGQLLQIANPSEEKGASTDKVKARVMWVRPGTSGGQDAGLQFEESPEVLGRSWVISVLNKVGMQAKVFNQRKYTRAAANLVGELELQSRETLPARVLDLGLGGALMAADRAFSPTTRMRLTVGPLGVHGALQVRCEVIHSRFDEGGVGWTHSVKFIEMSTSQTKLLGKYVVDLLKSATA